MSNNELSKIVAYENGDILDVAKVREVLLAYWKLSDVEKRAFQRLFEKPGITEKYSYLLKQ